MSDYQPHTFGYELSNDPSMASSMCKYLELLNAQKAIDGFPGNLPELKKIPIVIPPEVRKNMEKFRNDVSSVEYLKKNANNVLDVLYKIPSFYKLDYVFASAPNSEIFFDSLPYECVLRIIEASIRAIQ